MKKLLLLTSMLVLLISNLYAQSVGFSGIVTGKDNIPLKEAVIVVVDAVKSTALYTTITDSLGRYTVPKSFDSFILNISHVGFRSTTNTISLSAYSNRFIETSLDPLSMDMKEITVYGATPQVKRDGGKFVVDNVSNYPFVKGNNAQTLLRYIPMLEVNPEGKISILGRETSNIQINGREMPGMNITEALKSIPASDIDKIEIVAIAGSAYRAGSGSVLNIILKKRPNEGVKVNVSVGDSQSYFNNQNGSAYLSYANQKVNITSGASVSNSGYMSKTNERYNYYKNDLNTDIYAENGLRNLTLSGFFNMDYTINKKQVIGARLFVNSRDSKNNDDSQSTYRNISSGTVDSIYSSSGQTLTPYWNTGWGANVNYNLKTSDSGSELKLDLNYTKGHVNTESHTLYEKILNGSSIIANDFLQKRYNDVHSIGFKAEHNQIFNKSNKLKSGVALYYGNNYNDYFYGNRKGEQYVNDPNFSNTFLYDDITAAAFLSYERKWSEKFESVIGLRAEYYTADGLQSTTNKDVERKEFDLFPSLSLSYTISDKHWMSFDMSRSITRPSYRMLNPFITYLSPTTYRENNPDLRSCAGYHMAFVYSFFKDFSLRVSYYYTKDAYGELRIPMANNMTKYTTANIGDAHLVFTTLSMNKSLLNNYLYLAGRATLSYDRWKGSAEGMNVDISDLGFGLTIDAFVTLSKKSKWSMSTKYQWNSANEAAYGISTSSNYLELEVSKQFKTSTLSFGASNIVNPYKTTYKVMTDYSFDIRKRTYTRFYVSYTINLGNNKVKRVSDRKDSGVTSRL